MEYRAYHLMVVGRYDEGISELRKAENLDPLSLIIGAGLADVLGIAHRFDEAMQQIQKTLELDANFGIAHFQRGELLVQKHELEAAIAEFQRAIELNGHSWALDANLAYAYGVSGHKVDALRIAGELERQNQQNGSLEANIALIHVGLGNADEAITWLDKAYGDRFNPSIVVRPEFDSLRSDPRFKDLMRRLGLDNRSPM